jgi:hypothetical protein
LVLLEKNPNEGCAPPTTLASAGESNVHEDGAAADIFKIES